MLELTLVIVSYLIGSLSFAVIVCRMMGLDDPRNFGSNNPGATNVLRTGNKLAALLCLIGDFLKTFIPVAIISLLNSPELITGVSLASFLGHIFPIFFGFRGGKGVASAFGVWTALSWELTLITASVWLIFAKIFKISSLSSIVAFTVSLLISPYMIEETSILAATVIITLILLVRHKSNIKRLLSKRETILQKERT